MEALVLTLRNLPVATVCASLLCIGLAGCGAKQQMHPVKGTVKFSSGEPMPKGRVVVDSADGKKTSWGTIKPDGTFQMGTLTSNDGVPPGTYQVYFLDIMTDPPVDESSREGGFASSKAAAAFVSKPLINSKYLKKDKSGISFEVPKQLTWDIVVEPPK